MPANISTEMAKPTNSNVQPPASPASPFHRRYSDMLRRTTITRIARESRIQARLTPVTQISRIAKTAAANCSNTAAPKMTIGVMTLASQTLAGSEKAAPPCP